MHRPQWLMRVFRLPIRARLTIAFMVMMATVLAAAGVFLYAQFRGTLNAQTNDDLHQQVADIDTLVSRGHYRAIAAPTSPLVAGCRTGGCVAQIYLPDGQLLVSTLGDQNTLRLLSRPRAGHKLGRQAFDRRVGSLGEARVLAVSTKGPSGQRFVVAVAVSLGPTSHELDRLRTLLLIAGPLALLLASVGGYELARAALRPVDRMRSRAARITERRLSDRLPVADTGDEIAALGETLNAMLDRVEAAVARERRVVSDASHELRTPLTTLRAEVDLALIGDRGPAELRAALESASEEARRMTRLADDLLVLARADQGRLPLHARPLAARELLDAAAGRARAGAELQGRSVTVAEPPAGYTVLADPDRAAQVLDNLITNALRYGAGTITLSAEPGDGTVTLHVTDEGDGFPADVLPRAFERFGRGRNGPADEPGSGLGLALVEALALAHGGHADARNRPEGGADVSVTLPRA
jgi:two-component system, OmpR family, sensor kinase